MVNTPAQKSEISLTIVGADTDCLQLIGAGGSNKGRKNPKCSRPADNSFCRRFCPAKIPPLKQIKNKLGCTTSDSPHFHQQLSQI